MLSVSEALNSTSFGLDAVRFGHVGVRCCGCLHSAAETNLNSRQPISTARRFAPSGFFASGDSALILLRSSKRFLYASYQACNLSLCYSALGVAAPPPIYRDVAGTFIHLDHFVHRPVLNLSGKCSTACSSAILVVLLLLLPWLLN